MYKHVEDDQYLIKDVNIAFNNKYEEDDEKLTPLKGQLEKFISTKPNKKLGFTNRALYHYRNLNKPDTSWFKRWVIKQLSEKPALFDSSEVSLTSQNMQKYLRNKKGYYHATVEESYSNKRKRSKIKYNIDLQEQYTVHTVNYICEQEEIKKIIAYNSKQALINPGSPIDNSLFEQEKNRLYLLMQNNGFANFLTNDIIIQGDSTGLEKKVDIFIKIVVPEEGKHQKYTIGNINVFTEFNQSSTAPSLESIDYNNKAYFSQAGGFLVSPKVIDQKIFMETGQTYHRERHYKTIRKLTKLEPYKFVKITPRTNTEVDSLLDFDIYFTPFENRWVSENDIGFFYSTISSAGQNLIGVNAGSSLYNRNMFGGAERFSINGNAGIEFRIDKPTNGGRTRIISNSYNFGLDNNLNVPKRVDYLGLWKLFEKTGIASEERKNSYRDETSTDFRLGFNFQDNFNTYSLSTLNLSAGYIFDPNKRRRAIITPTGLNFINYEITNRFRDIIKNQPRTILSFQDNLFTGFIFKEFTYFYQSKLSRRNVSWAFIGNLEVSGLEIFGLNKLYNAITGNTNSWRINQSIDFGNFTKVDLDLRLYKEFTQSSSIANRLYLGLASPYGDDLAVPYIRQFFVGGPNSIRAWQERELGPGAYIDNNFDPDSTQFFQTGDIKLEFNIEYRYDLFWILEGAFFVDGGNVWSLRSDSRADAQFTKDFISSLAIGWGWGVRWDFTYFNIRLDFGYKLKNPRPDGLGNYFTSPIGQGIFGNPNVAVNYPF